MHWCIISGTLMKQGGEEGKTTMAIPAGKKRIQITITDSLLNEIDSLIRGKNKKIGTDIWSRSDFITWALNQQLTLLDQQERENSEW